MRQARYLERRLRGEFLTERHGYFHLRVDDRETLFTEAMLDSLEGQLRKVRAQQAGEIAL